jgi:GNAT superfamily N-acetyltransferase
MADIIQSNADAVVKLIQALPEFPHKTTADEIIQRTNKPHAQILVATVESQSAGFLVSYPDSDDVYYNWITGVLPDYRRQGLADRLMNHFEHYSEINGFTICRVKTMNRYRSMLLLLINRGYDIVSYTEPKITFEK